MDRSETRPVAPSLAADVIIQPWLAVDPGQGCECLVAGETECAASIVILAADEDVGGLAMRGKFLAWLSRLMLTMAGPRHDPPPGGPMALQLAGDEHRRRPDSTARGIRPGAGVNGRLRTIESAWDGPALLARQRRPHSGMPFARAVLSARKLAGV